MRCQQPKHSHIRYSAAVTHPLSELDAAREHLREVLRGREPLDLAQRPPNGAWSVVENLRHLLFAEQAHLGGFAPSRPAFSPLGLPPPGMMGSKRVGPAGTQPSEDAFEIFAAWDAAHAELSETIQPTVERFETALAKHLKHLRLHAGIIERLLSRAEWAKPQLASRSEGKEGQPG